MYIVRHMTSSPITVTPETLLPVVHDIFEEYHFRHLPVIDAEKRLIGMVTDRDLRSAYPSSILPEDKRRFILAKVEQTAVQSIMSRDIRSLPSLSTLDDALYLLVRDKVGVLPVVDEQQRILGVFSVQDLMKAYQQIYGIGERGSAFIAVKDDGNPKPLTRIVRVLEDNEIRFSRLTRVHSKDEANDIIYLRVQTFNINGVHKMLNEIGMDILMPDFIV